MEAAETKPNQVKLKQTSALLANNKRAERRRIKIAKARSGERRGEEKRTKTKSHQQIKDFKSSVKAQVSQHYFHWTPEGAGFHCTVLVFVGKRKEQQEQEGEEEEEEEGEERGQGGEGEDGSGRGGGGGGGRRR